MGNKRNIRSKLSKTFGRPGGRQSSSARKRNAKKQKKIYDKLKILKKVNCTPYSIKKKEGVLKLTLARIALNKAKKYKFIRDANSEKVFIQYEEDHFEGNRVVNLHKLQTHILEVTSHTAICENARNKALAGDSLISFTTEKRDGFYFLLKLKCNGCDKVFQIDNSDKLQETNIQEINLRCVWGSMVTGGGCSSLNECMGTLGIPGVSERTYCRIENEIGKYWKDILEEEMMRAGEEEKNLAIENDEFFQGIPSVSVVCDGGWSKRSHKHTYNAMAGVGVIFGLRTSKLLHIGIRNKLCYVCSRSETQNKEAPKHECFKNWEESSQSMETSIILEGFLLCEKKYGVRFMHMVADCDSSVYATLVQKIPVWGPYIQKIECANHATKCLRVNLEKLVAQKPHYKGKSKLTRNNIRKITVGVRCAIIMRSNEKNRKEAIKKLRKDIQNAGRHVLGYHDLCSTDFCKHKENDSEKESSAGFLGDESDENEDIILCQSDYWQDTMHELSEEEKIEIMKGGTISASMESEMSELLKDIYFYLNRLSEKSNRLIGNFTSNIAEAWMHVRCKFDGGKMFNKCFRGSFFARCYGGALRTLLGPAWSPYVYQKVTGKRPDRVFLNTYKQRARKYNNGIRSSKKKENVMKRKKRKFESNITTKKAKLDYGENVLNDTEDISQEELKKKCDLFLTREISNVDKDAIERKTRGQSSNNVWHNERKKRLTSSNFGEIMCRSLNNNNPNVVKRMLYSNFKGTIYTIKGQNEERNARSEYKNIKNKEQKIVKQIQIPGLIIDTKHPYLAASSDGIVELEEGGKGLIEIKTLLNTNKKMIQEAAQTDKTFCLKEEKGKIGLKKTHKYFYQIQGQLNIIGHEWCDLIARRVNPNDIFIERIYKDTELWENVMLPKLQDFYKSHLLPELAAPRHGTISGIRKPSLPWHERTVSHAVKKKTSTSAVPVCDIEVQDVTVNKCPIPEKRGGRTRKLKFVGRRIRQKWEDSDGVEQWYPGFVLGVTTGVDGKPSTVYQIQYENDKEIYDVEDLEIDYKEGNLEFEDL